MAVISISNEQADELLQMPKKVICGNTLLDEITIDQKFGMKSRLELASTENDFFFLWDIIHSAKNSLKVSLHYQEDETKIGLLRIDFNSGHKNPETITEDVPTKFHPYVGKVFTNQEHHVHYHVQSFPSLAWAIPLVDDGFEVKELNEGHDFYVNFSKAVTQFAKVINLQTHITFNVLLL